MAELKQSTGFKTLDKELQKDKYEGIIESYDNNRDGHWIYLEGYTFDPGGAHIVHERTVGDLIESLQRIVPCECEDCQSEESVWTDNRIHKL